MERGERYWLVTVDSVGMTQARNLREVPKRAQSESAKELHLAAKRLREQNLSLRDIGQVLGVSYQRAHPLVRSA